MGCSCKNNRINKYVDASCLPHDPWKKAEGILAVDRCDNLIVVDKPKYELTREQVEKLAKIIIDGDGNFALYNDGEYKATYTAEEINELFENYYTREETDGIINEVNERIDTVNSRFDDYYNRDEVDEKIEATEALFDNYYDKTESDTRFVKNGVVNDEVHVEATGEQVYTSQPGISFKVGYPSTPHTVVFDSNGAAIDGEQIVTQPEIEHAVFYDDDDQIRPRQSVILRKDTQLSGTAPDGRVLNLAEVNRLTPGNKPIADFGAGSAVFNMNSKERPTIELTTENGLEDHQVAYLDELENLQDNVDNQIDAIRDSIADHENEYQALKQSISDSFGDVHSSLDELDSRVTTNETHLDVHEQEIQSLREDLIAQEKFRGYFNTTDEITALPDPTVGDYAWNVDTGTVWAYDGTTWANTDVAIPDQTVMPSGSVPLMDHEGGEVGTSTEYARGDHRHPTDLTRAAADDLLNYYTKAESDVNLSDAIEDVVFYDDQNDIYTRKNLIVAKDARLSGIASDGRVLNLAEVNRLTPGNKPIADFGSGSAVFNMNSKERPTIQLTTENGLEAHEVAYLDEVDNLNGNMISQLDMLQDAMAAHEDEYQNFRQSVDGSIDEMNDTLDDLEDRVSLNETATVVNAQDIQSLRDDMIAQEKFRGYFNTTDEITDLADPTIGDYAWNAETGTVWTYDGTTWANTNVAVPDQTVIASGSVPLMDYELGEVGTSTEYARGDHRHPTDMTRAAADDLLNYYTMAEADDNLDDAIEDAVFYDDLGDIRTRRNVILPKNANLLGMAPDGRELNLAEISRMTDAGVPVADFGSKLADFTIQSQSRPAVQLAGESAADAHAVAYVEDVEAAGDALSAKIDSVESGLTSRIQTFGDELTVLIDEVEEDLISKIEAVDNGLTASIGSVERELTSKIESVEGDMADHEAEYLAFRGSVNVAFDQVSTDLGELGGQVSENTSGIQFNRTEIEQIRQDLTDTEHFRGYYFATNEITAINNPQPGDYAYNAETGTKWIYNGTTWADSLVNVPDQTVDAYDGTPLMDNGNGDAGSSNQYSRGDHRHPSDILKADKADLDNYLLLAGNSPSNPMTGDIWLGTANDLYLTDSGNSFIGQDANTQTTLMVGAGGGGIDLQTELGTVKANGKRVITEGVNAQNVKIESPVIDLTSNIAGESCIRMNGELLDIHSSGSIGIASVNDSTIYVEDGSFNIDVAGKAYYGKASVPGNEIARVSDIDNIAADLTNLEQSLFDVQMKLPGLLSKDGDTMTGDLTMQNANIILNDEQYVGFYGDGRVRIGYNKAAEELRIVTTSTDNGVDVVTNPSYESSKFKYNGQEVATRTYVDDRIAEIDNEIDLDSYYTIPQVNALLTEKVNKSGDTMTGFLTVNDRINVNMILPIGNAAATVGASGKEFDSGYFKNMNVSGAIISKSINDVEITAEGDGTMFLADDGNYKSVLYILDIELAYLEDEIREVDLSITTQQRDDLKYAIRNNIPVFIKSSDSLNEYSTFIPVKLTHIYDHSQTVNANLSFIISDKVIILIFNSYKNEEEGIDNFSLKQAQTILAKGDIRLEKSGDGKMFLANDGGYKSIPLEDYLPLAGGKMTGDIVSDGTADLGSDSERWANIYGGNMIASTVSASGAVTGASFNGVQLKNTGSGELYLAEDGNYKAVPEVKVYETSVTDVQSLTLPETPAAILNVFFERVMLYSDEFSIAGNTLTLTASDLDYSGTNKLKIIYR